MSPVQPTASTTPLAAPARRPARQFHLRDLMAWFVVLAMYLTIYRLAGWVVVLPLAGFTLLFAALQHRRAQCPRRG